MDRIFHAGKNRVLFCFVYIKFIFTLTSKLQNYTLNIIENLYRANEVFVKKGDVQKAPKEKQTGYN